MSNKFKLTEEQLEKCCRIYCRLNGDKESRWQTYIPEIKRHYELTVALFEPMLDHMLGGGNIPDEPPSPEV